MTVIVTVRYSMWPFSEGGTKWSLWSQILVVDIHRRPVQFHRSGFFGVRQHVERRCMPRQLRVVSPVALIQKETLFTAHSGPAIFGLMINHSNLPTCSGSNAWFSSKSVTPSPAFHLTAALADCGCRTHHLFGRLVPGGRGTQRLTKFMRNFIMIT